MLTNKKSFLICPLVNTIHWLGYFLSNISLLHRSKFSGRQVFLQQFSTCVRALFLLGHLLTFHSRDRPLDGIATSSQIVYRNEFKSEQKTIKRVHYQWSCVFAVVWLMERIQISGKSLQLSPKWAAAQHCNRNCNHVIPKKIFLVCSPAAFSVVVVVSDQVWPWKLCMATRGNGRDFGRFHLHHHLEKLNCV